MVRNCKYLTAPYIFFFLDIILVNLFSCYNMITWPARWINGLLIDWAVDGFDWRAIRWHWWNLWCGGECAPEARQTCTMDQDSCKWGCPGLSFRFLNLFCGWVVLFVILLQNIVICCTVMITCVNICLIRLRIKVKLCSPYSYQKNYAHRIIWDNW